MNASDGRHQLRIGNVNSTPLERVLGVDLIYRHLDSDTFVLVQYKRMRRNDAGSPMAIRPLGACSQEVVWSNSSDRPSMRTRTATGC